MSIQGYDKESIDRLVAENKRLTADRKYAVGQLEIVRGEMEISQLRNQELIARNKVLEDVLLPFAKAYKALFPSEAITLHDLRMAFEAIAAADKEGKT